MIFNKDNELKPERICNINDHIQLEKKGKGTYIWILLKIYWKFD